MTLADAIQTARECAAVEHTRQYIARHDDTESYHVLDYVPYGFTCVGHVTEGGTWIPKKAKVDKDLESATDV